MTAHLSEIRGVASGKILFDEEDLPLLLPYSWSIGSHGYKMWGVNWHSVNSGTPGFTWDYAPTSGRRSESRAKFAEWVGFQPVSVVKVTTTEYATIEPRSIS